MMKDNDAHYVKISKTYIGHYRLLVDGEFHGYFNTQTEAWKRGIRIMNNILKKERKEKA